MYRHQKNQQVNEKIENNIFPQHFLPFTLELFINCVSFQILWLSTALIQHCSIALKDLLHLSHKYGFVMARQIVVMVKMKQSVVKQIILKIKVQLFVSLIFLFRQLDMRRGRIPMSFWAPCLHYYNQNLWWYSTMFRWQWWNYLWYIWSSWYYMLNFHLI